MTTISRSRSTSTATIGGLVLGLAAVVCLVVPLSAQQNDPNARPAAANNGAAATKTAQPRMIPSAKLGVIDMDYIFKNYDKAKTEFKRFNDSVQNEKAKNARAVAEVQAEMEKLSKLQPGGPDFKRQEAVITDMKLKAASSGQIAERDFARQEAELWLGLYSEVQSYAAKFAEVKGMTMVVQTSNERPTVEDPRSVLAYMSRTVVHHDPSTDITQDVLYSLNYYYKKKVEAAKVNAAPAPPANPNP